MMNRQLAKSIDLVKANWPMDARRAPSNIGQMKTTNFRMMMLDGLKRTGLSLAELSRRSGVSYDALNKVKIRDNASTSAENAAAVARVLGVDWDSAEVITSVATSEDAASDLVPVYDVAASAGHGLINDYEPIAFSMAFPPDYLRFITKSDPRNLQIISVKGDSMQPTLHDDDLVMLDRSKTSLNYDGLFVLLYGDALHVKRVSRSSTPGRILVISDNRSIYPPQEHAANDVTVIGKVIWYGRKV
jgi:phage repressor protein C with HTH and peptisase S24 domain